MIASYTSGVLTRARSTTWYGRLSRHPVLHQFVRYALVGALNVAVYFLIYNLLRIVEVPPVGAQSTAFLVTSVQSFALNRTWAFKDRRSGAIIRRYLLFLSFTLIGLLINVSAFKVFLIPFGGLGRLGENLALVAALPFSVMWNFFTYRRWTFKPQDAASQVRDAS